MSEIVLLVEEGNDRLRAKELTGHVDHVIIERQHDECGQFVRTWVYAGERALTGQRIFREHAAPVKEEAEQPIFDELRVKKPLPLGVDKATHDRIASRLNKFRK